MQLQKDRRADRLKNTYRDGRAAEETDIAKKVVTSRNFSAKTRKNGDMKTGGKKEGKYMSHFVKM
jgi:hypothetical protein